MPLKIVYSHNKTGIDRQEWEKEIPRTSNGRFEFIPFDHGSHTNLGRLYEAGGLDDAYRRREPGLMRLYRDVEGFLRETAADVLFVTNLPVYHPDFLRKLPVYRVLYSTDDTPATYRRTIPYLHAYHHVFTCTPGYSDEMSMVQKMRECGAQNADWLPLGVFDYEFDSRLSEDSLFSIERDIDLIYIGSCFLQKLPLLAAVQKAFGRNFRMHGMFAWKHNAYFIARHGSRQWIRPVSHAERTRLYQRTKIGFNIHVSDYSVGNQRLYHLPAHGVMQISDCPTDLNEIYDVGREVVSYATADQLIEQIRYYLAAHEERLAIARAGYRRTMKEYRFQDVTRRAAELIELGMRSTASQ